MRKVIGFLDDILVDGIVMPLLVGIILCSIMSRLGGPDDVMEFGVRMNSVADKLRADKTKRHFRFMRIFQHKELLLMTGIGTVFLTWISALIYLMVA